MQILLLLSLLNFTRVEFKLDNQFYATNNITYFHIKVLIYLNVL